jgi:stage III sporulation protein SpoIIIAA
MQNLIVDDLQAFLGTLPPHIQRSLSEREDLPDLLEIVLDLGRLPEARFIDQETYLDSHEVTEEDIQYVISHIGVFGADNRAGIERTLHRISAIRNRNGKIVGLTSRVGRAVFGTVRVIEDLVFTDKSILLLGRPGVGKTTMLREVARVLSVDAGKRVIIVDTSNEIAGDGDIPHPYIGRARRMQVRIPELQHAVMIEAVENHMPEAIVIDEMGTELEAQAARTIAERGVKLVATAHGNTLENLLMNPTLSDLVGGVQTVILGDEEARRRRTQKTILERKAPPTFDIVVEIRDRDKVAVHPDVASTVDRLLRGLPAEPEQRWLSADKEIQNSRQSAATPITDERSERSNASATKVNLFGVNRGRVEYVVKVARLPVEIVDDLSMADILLTTKSHYQRRPKVLRNAEDQGKPIFVLRKNTAPQIEQFLRSFTDENVARSKMSQEAHMEEALQEAETGAERVLDGEEHVKLSPQIASIRRLQHVIVQRYNLRSRSIGRNPNRYVTISR